MVLLVGNLIQPLDKVVVELVDQVVVMVDQVVEVV